jgi:serine phosphatase RsbU (regulator of sigma subunit)
VFAEESSLIADSLKIMELMVDNYLLLGDIYSNLKDYKSCNNVLLKHIEAKEAIQNDYYHNQLTEMEVKYKLDIKEKHIQLLLKDSLHKNEIVVNQQNQLSWKKRETNYFVIGGLFLIIGILLTAYFLLKYRKVNKVIFAQKSKVEHQKSIIEIKNRDITDSIKYAERIQKTMLPTDDNITENLKNSFVLYKPKDIVAGDFYWLEKKEKAVLFAVADCTGHGVPGAIVSVVCNNALNRAVRQYGLSTPNQILDKAKEIVVDTFSKNEDVRDGMDVAVCSLDGKKLLYSGANNPLWLFRSGELIIYPADRQPVGKYEYEKKFSSNEIDLIEGDTVYIFSDGYADQFGGQKNKKFKSSQLKKLLLSVQQYDMKIQQEILNKEFDKWRGNFEQMDDVCLMGVRI